jgi:capsular exopolysaccharide synthesis family protein
MDKQTNSLPHLTGTNGNGTSGTNGNGKNGHSAYIPFQNPATAAEDKWDLGWLMAVTRRRSLLMSQVALGTALLAGGVLFVVAKATIPEYSGKFQLLVEPITAEEQLARSSTRAQGMETTDLQRIDIEQSSLDYESQIRVLQGPKLLEPVVNQVNQRYPGMTYETLIKNLKISRITTLTSDKREQGTKLIDVTYQDADQEKIKFILEQLSQAYLNYSLKERQSTIRRGVKFIDTQLPPLRKRVDSLQQQIQALRQRSSIVDPEEQVKRLSLTAGRLDEVEADNQTILAEAQAKRNALTRQVRSGSVQSALGEQSYYKSILEQYQKIEGQIAEEETRLTPDNPAMQSLLAKRRNLRNLLDQEASRVVDKANDAVNIASARLRTTNRAQAKTDEKVQQLPTVSRQYTDLKRELTLATDSLNKFSARREALQIDAAQQEIPWELAIAPRIIADEKGRSVKVNSINKVRFLALISAVAILMGVGVGFLVDTTQDLFYTTDDVKQSTRLRLLGVIPHTDSLPEVSYPMAEAFRSLSKNLRLLSRNHTPVRSLVITSVESGNGKTTIALNLARAAAAMGQRVLLVDGDLRRPRIHELLELSNQKGLSHLLMDHSDIQSALQSSLSCPNVAVLTAGKSSMNSAELLTPTRVESLFQKLQSMFDLVIVDTPPLLGLADSGLLASQCDGVALVVRLGKTSRPSVMAALEELKLSSTSVLGVIANDAPDTASLSQINYSRARLS